MERFRIYKDLEVSYREVEDALIQLGFRNASDTKRFYFVNDKFNAIFLMPFKPSTNTVLKAHFAANSYGLWATGVIKDIHDFAKLIEKNRLASQQA
jgi:hypothetical protein